MGRLIAAFCLLASSDDLHARAVRAEVQASGHTCAIVDIGTHARQLDLAIRGGSVAMCVDDVVIDTSTIVWTRRPEPRAVDPRVVDPRLVDFAQKQWRHAFFGGLSALGCRIVNDPAAEQRASFKPYQLKVAAASGLRVPETVITNSPEDAEAFRRRLDAVGMRTVYKPLTALRYHIGETRLLTDAIDTGDSLRLAPVIFQQCIERGRDLRVLVAGRHIAAASVTTPDDDLLDWRLDPRSDFAPATLSPGLERAVRRVVGDLGLHTASLDLRADPDGDVYFFEANPGGQFLMLDRGTTLNTAKLFAQSLIDVARDVPATTS